MSQLKVFLLGPPRVELGGEPVDVKRRKAMAILAYLAVTGRAHSRDELATLLWPESDQSRARGALRRTLSVLNTALAGDWLEADREMVDLDPQAQIWLDVEEFTRLLAASREHDHPADETCPACLSRLADAVALYQDDFLAGFTLRDCPQFDEWQFFQAENLRQELAGALERLVHGYVAQQGFKPALDYARRWLWLDPLHEPAHRRLMRLYAQTDQRAATLRQYEECTRILEEELGVPPSEETTALYEQIRSGDLSPEVESPEDTKEEIAGSQPGLVPPALPPFLATASPAPPRPAARPFVGRKEELARLHHRLEVALSGQGQVTFVTGEAGSGKTALVQEFARQAQTASPDLVMALGNCNAHTGVGDPYLPFREILGLLTGDVESRWARGSLTQESAIRLWHLFPAAAQVLVEVGPNLIDTFLPGPALLARTAAFASDQAGWPAQVKRVVAAQSTGGGDSGGAVGQSDLFEQFARVIQTLATQTPLLLIIDDAQWGDTASINLLFHLGRQLQDSRVLLAVTYRPDDVALKRPVASSGFYGSTRLEAGDRHPLEPVVNELKRTYGDIEIDLGQASSHHFIDALLDTQPNGLGREFRTALYHQTQGHPLFTVELLQDMQERGDLVRDEQGRWVEGPSLNWRALPARVEAVIEERMGRLEENLRELLTVASVEGELFTAQVVARVQQVGERHLLRSLSQVLAGRHQLVREQEEIKVNGAFLSQYRFAHTLFQQYLYDSLSAGERRLLHGEVAAALESLYAGHIEAVTVQLARHYVESGQAEKAVDYLLQAGDRARDLYAHQEAADFYQQALSLLKEQGAYDRAARTLMKLGLTYHLAFDFVRARQAYTEGFAMWQRVGATRTPPLQPAPHALRMVGTEPLTADPALAGDGASGRLTDQLFSGLAEQTPEMEVAPGVAHSWELLAGGRKYIFHLRDDVRWSDGTPVTADDFAYAWKRVLNPATDSVVANLLFDLKGARAFYEGELSDPNRLGVQALDPVTLMVELEGPTGYFPQLLTHSATYPVPRHALEAHGDAWTDPEHLVTNGPFRLESLIPGRSLTLIRNPEYRGQATGNLQRVEWTFREESSVELEMYTADQLDLAALWSLSGLELDRVRQRFANDYLSGPLLNTQYIGFDVSRPPFNDRRVRRALAMAIDKETLANVVLGGYAFPATGGFVPPGMPGHSAEIGLPYDPKQARRLLAEAGYPGGAAFPPVEWLTLPGVELVMSYFQTQWLENLGLNLTWQSVDVSLHYDRLNKNPPHLFRIGWKADYPDPDNFLRTGSFQQQTRWWNETYQRAVEEARRVTDQEARMKLYQQADRLLMEEAAIVPYLYVRRHQLVKPWVTRYPTSPLRSAFWKDVVIEPH